MITRLRSSRSRYKVSCHRHQTNHLLPLLSPETLLFLLSPDTLLLLLSSLLLLLLSSLLLSPPLELLLLLLLLFFSTGDLLRLRLSLFLLFSLGLLDLDLLSFFFPFLFSSLLYSFLLGELDLSRSYLSLLSVTGSFLISFSTCLASLR